MIASNSYPAEIALKPTLSIIIPALNEETAIRQTLQSLHQLSGVSEIIVVDGGSSDGTVSISTPWAKVISSAPGRARQMNQGALAASGDLLLFLHADTVLPPDAVDLLYQAAADERVSGGAFRVCFDDNSWLFKLIALGSNLRARCAQIYFGDQGIFARRSSFLEVGGYPDIPLMEDWELTQRLKKRGKLILLSASVTTSSRRWHKHGVWRTILLMHKLKLLYLLGVSPKKLIDFYPSHKVRQN